MQVLTEFTQMDRYKIPMLLIGLIICIFILQQTYIIPSSGLFHERSDVDGLIVEGELSEDMESLQYYRTAAAIHANSRLQDVNVLHTMMYPSWKYVNSLSHLDQERLINHPQIQFNSSNRITIDLLFFCEPDICDSMPIDCAPMPDLIEMAEQMDTSLIREAFKKEPARCFYHELSAFYQNESMETTGYRFMPSLYFLIQEPFISIRKMYDFVLRTDMDAMITPLSLLWIPPNKYSFGHRYMSSAFVTQQRLRFIAETKLHLKHA